MTSTAVFWCDLGGAHGSGHAMRCIALAEEVEKRGDRPLFMVDAASVPFVQSQLEQRGFEYKTPFADHTETIGFINSQSPKAVFIDSYLLPEYVYSKLYATHLTVAIVDGDPSFRKAHLYVDQNIGAERDRWTYPLGCENSVHLSGIQYALIRDSVLESRPRRLEHQGSHPVPSVLAVLGGTDPYRVAPTITKALKRTAQPFNLTVIAANHQIEQEILSLPTREDQLVTVIAPTQELPQLVRRANLVISASGTSSWELLCLGAPTVFTCVAANQEAGYSRLIEAGLGIGIGSSSTILERADQVSQVLGSALLDTQMRIELAEVAWQSVDGLGRQRVLNKLHEIQTNTSTATQ